eukprot:3644428-Rhodomonas_salina.1
MRVSLQPHSSRTLAHNSRPRYCTRALSLQLAVAQLAQTQHTSRQPQVLIPSPRRTRTARESCRLPGRATASHHHPESRRWHS